VSAFLYDVPLIFTKGLFYATSAFCVGRPPDEYPTTSPIYPPNNKSKASNPTPALAQRQGLTTNHLTSTLYKLKDIFSPENPYDYDRELELKKLLVRLKVQAKLLQNTAFWNWSSQGLTNRKKIEAQEKFIVQAVETESRQSGLRDKSPIAEIKIICKANFRRIASEKKRSATDLLIGKQKWPTLIQKLEPTLKAAGSLINGEHRQALQNLPTVKSKAQQYEYLAVVVKALLKYAETLK
jgi:hypothetical protein